MNHSTKLIAAVLLTFGVMSAHADSETDRYMASAETAEEEARESQADERIAMSTERRSGQVLAAYFNPSPGGRSCHFYSWCRNASTCGDSSTQCPCMPNDISNPRAGGTCL